jgi:arginyl-tRNA--protein-N-Asp/Glu arginylyltransferase
MSYLSWQEQIITEFSENNITEMYADGYVFTRKGKGVMQQTRSARIDLPKFELSSENRRILKKTDELRSEALVLPVENYDYKIGKLAKDFYTTKFGEGTMSAQKIKEMLSSPEKSNFNSLLVYSVLNAPIGYAICYVSAELIHYAYPFYDLVRAPKDIGLGMMIRAIVNAKQGGAKYAYLGSLQNKASLYKLQFAGLEWFDGKSWQTDIEIVKKLLNTSL